MQISSEIYDSFKVDQTRQQIFSIPHVLLADFSFAQSKKLLSKIRKSVQREIERSCPHER